MLNRSIISILLSISLFFLTIQSINAQTIMAVNSTAWSLNSTWDLGRPPIPGEIVEINGHTVTLDVSAQVAQINISNDNVTGNDAGLITNGNGVYLQVDGDLTLTSTDKDYKADFRIQTTDSVYVNGTLTLTRTVSNTTNERCQLKVIDDGRLTIQGDLNIDYFSSGSEEKDNEVYITDNAKLEVRGNCSFRVEGGKDCSFASKKNAVSDLQNNLNINISASTDFLFELRENSEVNVGGSFTLTNSNPNSLTPNSVLINVDNTGGTLVIDGNLNLESTEVDQIVGLTVDGSSSSATVNGNIHLLALDEQNVGIDLLAGTNFTVGATIFRTPGTNYGFINMDNNSKIHFSGINDQTIPADDAAGNGADAFNFSKISIDNSTGNLTLEGALSVSEELELINGIIKTASWQPITIEDNAIITGGSETAYIDGPLIKLGRTNGAAFTFPIGNNGKYAPLTIDEITGDKIEYTAEYIGCPPPTGFHNGDLQSVNQYGHWTLERGDSDLLGNITLHWNDPDLLGITDTASLVVAGYNSSTGWYNLGHAPITDDIASGVAGSIKNDLGCPPPTGLNTFTLGSTDAAENVLPIELTNFSVFKNNDNSKVFLEWETLSEENSDYFIIQKSNDGMSYREVDRVQAAQNSNSRQFYTAQDTEPNKGNNYYRIMQIDLDGIMSFSDLKNVFIQNNEELPSIFPNPIKDHLRLYSNSFKNDDDIPVLIFDITGKCIYRNKHQSQNGQLFLTSSNLNINNPGIYFISYVHNGTAYSLEFIKGPN